MPECCEIQVVLEFCVSKDYIGRQFNLSQQFVIFRKEA
jgi:hypothetical protein